MSLFVILVIPICGFARGAEDEGAGISKGAETIIPKDTLVMGMDTGIFKTLDPAQMNEPPVDVLMKNVYL